MPPESILEFDWSYPADIWSLGCILYELFTGKQLFPDFTRLTEQSLDSHDEQFSIAEKTIQCAFYEHFSTTRNSDFCQGFSPLVLAKTRIGPRLKSSRPYPGSEKPVMLTKDIFKIEGGNAVVDYDVYKHHIPDYYLPQKYSEIVQRMIVIDPTQRPSAEELLVMLDTDKLVKSVRDNVEKQQEKREMKRRAQDGYQNFGKKRFIWLDKLQGLFFKIADIFEVKNLNFNSLCIQ